MDSVNLFWCLNWSESHSVTSFSSKYFIAFWAMKYFIEIDSPKLKYVYIRFLTIRWNISGKNQLSPYKIVLHTITVWHCHSISFLITATYYEIMYVKLTWTKEQRHFLWELLWIIMNLVCLKTKWKLSPKTYGCLNLVKM